MTSYFRRIGLGRQTDPTIGVALLRVVQRDREVYPYATRLKVDRHLLEELQEHFFPVDFPAVEHLQEIVQTRLQHG